MLQILHIIKTRTIDRMNGSLCARNADVMTAGWRQENMAPNKIIFPIRGSTGNVAK